eukprot:5669379-Pyramimonas_sp.AAC.1
MTSTRVPDSGWVSWSVSVSSARKEMQALENSTISYSMMRTFFLGPVLYSGVRTGGGGARAAHRPSQVQCWYVGLWGVKMAASA